MHEAEHHDRGDEAERGQTVRTGRFDFHDGDHRQIGTDAESADGDEQQRRPARGSRSRLKGESCQDGVGQQSPQGHGHPQKRGPATALHQIASGIFSAKGGVGFKRGRVGEIGRQDHPQECQDKDDDADRRRER